MCSEAQHQKAAARRRKKITTKDTSGSDSDSGEEENLSDEEVEFDDLPVDLDDASDNEDAMPAHDSDNDDDDDDEDGGQVVGFNEEDVEFSDDDGKYVFCRHKSNRTKIPKYLYNYSFVYYVHFLKPIFCLRPGFYLKFMVNM